MSKESDLATAAAIAQAEQGADRQWLAAAGRALVQVARSMDEFTTDDIWALIPPDFTTPEPRAMGFVVSKARRHGLIENTNRTMKTERKESHNRPLTIWKSLLR